MLTRLSRSKLVASILLIAILSATMVPPQAEALVVQYPLAKYLDGLRKQGYLTNGGVLLSINGTGARAAANLTVAFPPEVNTEIGFGLNFDFGMTCGGMDFNAEAFANVDLKAVVQWLKQTLTSMAFLYILAMRIGSSTMGSALDAARAIGQTFTLLLQSPCQLGQQLGTLAAKKGWGAVAECLSQMKLGKANTITELLAHCRVNPPEDENNPGKPAKGKTIDICREQMTYAYHNDQMLAALLGDSGWTWDVATGEYVYHKMPDFDWEKNINKVYTERKQAILVALDKIRRGQSLTPLDINSLTGPTVRLYQEDINNLYLLSNYGSLAVRDTQAEFLASAITIGELTFAARELSDMITTCQASDRLTQEQVDALQRLKENMHVHIDQLKKELPVAGSVRDHLEKLNAEARKLTRSILVSPAEILATSWND